MPPVKWMVEGLVCCATVSESFPQTGEVEKRDVSPDSKGLLIWGSYFTTICKMGVTLMS